MGTEWNALFPGEIILNVLFFMAVFTDIHTTVRNVSLMCAKIVSDLTPLLFMFIHWSRQTRTIFTLSSVVAGGVITVIQCTTVPLITTLGIVKPVIMICVTAAWVCRLKVC